MKKCKRILCLLLCLCLCCPVFSLFARASAATVQTDNLRQLPAGTNLIANKLHYRVDYKSPSDSCVKTTYFHENASLTDGDLSTDWHDAQYVFADYNGGNPVIYTGGECRCDIVYCLDKVTDISKICLINHQNASLSTERYEIYASSELRSLFQPKKQNRLRIESRF